MRTMAALLLLAVPLVACANTYHPEYHPVTVSNINQTTSSPVSIGGAPRPVTVMPSPGTGQQPLVIGPMTPEPPPGFFDH